MSDEGIIPVPEDPDPQALEDASAQDVQNPLAQDPDVRQPKISLREFAALLRIAAGKRGWGTFLWSGQGYVYDVRLVRADPVPPEVDVDETVENIAGIVARIVRKVNPDAVEPDEGD